MVSSGVDVHIKRGWGGRGGGGGRAFSWKKNQCRLLTPCDLLLWLCMSLYKRCSKAVLDGCIGIGQAGQRVFGFLNGALHFVDGALTGRVEEHILLQCSNSVVVIVFYIYEEGLYGIKRKHPYLSSCIAEKMARTQTGRLNLYSRSVIVWTSSHRAIGWRAQSWLSL